MTQTDYIDRIKHKAKDEDSRLSDADWSEALEDALSEYSQAHPHSAIIDLSGDGTAFLELPADWDPETSDLIRLDELDNRSHPSEVRRNRLSIELRPNDTPRLYRHIGYFSSGQTYRLRYTLAHTITDTASTVPSGDAPAVVALAASFACTRLAAAYASNISPRMGAVTIDQENQTRKFRDLAKDFHAEYERACGGGSTSAQRASGRMKTWRGRSTLV